MNNITLKNLCLKNFKGIKELDIDFSKVTSIKGENATGKTTIFDAFTYLMFDKDSQDRSKFEVQPLDTSNNVIHMLDTSVEGTLYVNGKVLILKKILKEKWVRKRGEEQTELKGTETSYYIDEVPAKMGEYKTVINNLIDENLFKLLSNPLYFSTNMKWQDRRKVLLDIIGDISSDEIINYKDDLKALTELLKDKDVDTLKKQIQAKKKKLTDDKKNIPSRVDENTKSIKEVDFKALEFDKNSIKEKNAIVDEQLQDSSKINDEVLKQKDRLYDLKIKSKDIEYDLSKKAEEPKQEMEKELSKLGNIIWRLDSQTEKLLGEKTSYENQISVLEKNADELRDQWSNVKSNKLEFDESKFICPTCKRDFDAGDINIKKAEMTENFNQNKAKKLTEIRAEGTGINESIKNIQEKMKDLNLKWETSNNEIKAKKTEQFSLQEKINNFKNDFSLDVLKNDKGYQKITAEILEIEGKLKQPATVNEQVQLLKQKKSHYEMDLAEITGQLMYKKSNEDLRKRIKELLEDEKKLSQQIATLEGQEYLCEEFIKTKVELLEKGINSDFKFVTFKLFDTQVNGGISECCEALVEGVPFTNVNTAAQINAGLDIINTLARHYKIEVPLFVDSRESINDLIETDSQVINLIVSLDKTLKIENEEA